tara:strand:+ start:179 stop:994 length:816 start_codon:yes stop_codon:yes gene_type:complete
MTEIENYTELHIYDFDNTLFSTRHYDENDGVNSKWIQYILNDGIKSFVKARPERFKHKVHTNKFSVNSNPVHDYDQNNRYEVLYDEKPWTAELYKSFNNKIRSNIQLGQNIGGDTNKKSYYIKVDPRWYYTSKNFTGGDIIWQPTGNALKKSLAQSNIYTIILTGRRDTTELRLAIKSILKKNLLMPDELHLSPGGSTAQFKITTIENILNRHPAIHTLIFWDDRRSQADKFRAYFNNKKNINFSINMVNRKREHLKEFVTRVVKSFNERL